MRCIAAAMLLFVATPLPAQAHSWYDWFCCNHLDCGPTTPSQVIRFATRSGQLGYVILDDRLPDGREFVQDGQLYGKTTQPIIRETPLGDPHPYHVCILGGKVRCLYIREDRF